MQQQVVYESEAWGPISSWKLASLLSICRLPGEEDLDPDVAPSGKCLIERGELKAATVSQLRRRRMNAPME